MNRHSQSAFTANKKEKKYYNGCEIEFCCNILEVDMNRIFKREGISIGESGLKGLKLTAKESSNVFHSILDEYGKDDFHLKLANGFVTAPVGLVHIGLVASENVADGIARVTKIKPLSTPTKWQLTNSSKGIELRILDVSPDFTSNGYDQIMSFIWIVKTCRNCTLKPVVPKRLVISCEVPYIKEIEKDLGCSIEVSTYNVLEFDRNAADLKIYSRNDSISSLIDSNIDYFLAETESSKAICKQAERCIKEFLPSGNVTASRISRELGMSKRTFERRLKQEGVTFSELLKTVRSDLAIQYLRDEKYLFDEICFMLGFEEPNSFSRAFKKWHGSTPNQFRKGHRP